MRLFQGLPIWPKLLLKALLVMLVPLQFQITSISDLLSLPFNGLLFTSWVSGYPYFTGFVPALQYSMSDIVPNFLLGLFLAFPSIVFNYRLVKSPVNKPLRNLAVGIWVISSFVVFMAMIIVSFSMIYYISYLLLQNIMAFATIAIGAFVILPMIQRQAVLIASPEDMHCVTMREIDLHPQLKVRREKTLATILWIGLFFLPYIMITMNDPYYAYTTVYSFAYLINNSSNYLPIFEYGPLVISGTVIPIIYLPIFGIQSALRFVYVRDIYRHLKHEITFRSMMYMGILGDIFPVIGYMALSGFLSPYSLVSSSLIPIPCLSLLGLTVARLHRSVLPYANRIWEDVDARMWFEKGEEARPVITVPEKPYRPSEETITVPLTYVLVSQIRKRRHNNHSHQDNEE